MKHLDEDYTISFYSSSVNEGRKISKTTSVSGDGSKTITFNNHFGMSHFGTVPSSIILRFSDGSSNHDFVAIHEGEGEAGSFGTANQFGAGSNRPANYVVDEMVAKLNASSLNLTAAAVAGNNSTNASLKITPDEGATATITEDPNNSNSGNFGASSGYSVVTDTGAGSSSKIEIVAAPFRFASKGAFNLRLQSTDNPYKTFIV